ncbi:p53-like transcription factor [Hortaea werneckii]|nr:p53-like transcription factor [Hortaea werneckii]KAI6897082.1 p53-like transcription factor [Hortaea werneckii]KAI6938265.1 p53-like transcription factor [Hortaea werneckii]KAI6980079.1 p53-like transcription factor [Hortaea werneckii]KAI6991522.1 p53-like transcription factor [Hortaea werneckii]
MDQGAIIQHPLPLQSEYSIQSEQDFNDHFVNQSNHSAYATSSSVDHLRRDGAPNSFAFAATNHPHGARFVPDRGSASDASSYHPASFTDPSSGSISTSPSSAASSLQAYTNYQGTHYTSVPAIPGAVQPQPQAFVTSSYAGTRASSQLDGSVSCMLPPPTRHTISSGFDTGDRESYATNPYSSRSQLSPHTQPGFGSYPDTPRTVLGAPSTLSPGLSGYGLHMNSPNGFGSSTPNESLNFPWPNLEILLDMTCEGQAITPEIHAKVEKGFFLANADQKWTCYRRNYFSVACNFELHPSTNNGRLYLKRNNNQEQIQAMGMRLSAAVDGSGGKNIELIQHTPKRDNGPKTKIEVTKVAPTPSNGRNDHTVSPHGIYQVPMATYHAPGQVPGPLLPLQGSGETNGISPSLHQNPQLSPHYGYSSSTASHMPVPGSHTTHTFERVQFKQATANNGKRRASQQYFHLIVELFADVRDENSNKASWVKIAQRVSDKIVVRGRSPSHYSNEGNGQNGRTSASGGSGYSTMGGGSYTGWRGASILGHGSIGSSSGYRGTHRAMNPCSEGDGSGSSPGSVDEGAVDADHPLSSMMSNAERAGFQEADGYQYYPGPIYEDLPQTLPPLAKVESNGTRWSTEPRQYAVKAEYNDAVPGNQWSMGGCGRFQGVESSRGYFPDLSAGYS